jgi:hypothetical protein
MTILRSSFPKTRYFWSTHTLETKQQKLDSPKRQVQAEFHEPFEKAEKLE